MNTPANAHRVIGVGNFDVQTQNQITSQSRGPAPTAASSRTSRRRRTPRPPAPPRTRLPSVQRDERRHAVRGRRGGTAAQLAARHELQHRPGPGLRAADPVRPAALPVQQHHRRRSDSASDRRLGVVGQGIGRQRRNDRHPAIDQRVEPEHARRCALVARERVPVPLSGDSRSTMTSTSTSSTRVACRASSISIPSVFERARVAAESPGHVEAPHPRLQRPRRSPDGLLGRARATLLDWARSRPMV